MMSRARSFFKNFSSHFSATDVWAIVMIGLCLATRLWWINYTNYTEEDAFITFRFARQLAAGHGFVYNPGDKIYGTTTPLFTMLLSVWMKFITNDIILGARIFNVLAAGGTILFTWQALRSQKYSAAAQLLPLAALVFSIKLIYMDTQGMETPLVLCLMAASWYAWTTGKVKWAGFLAGLLLWVRVDMIFWPVTLMIVTGLSNPKQALQFLVFTSITYLPWVILAALYFGSPIPHTIIAKWVAYSQFNLSPYLSHFFIILGYLSPVNLPQKLQFLGPPMLWSVIVWATWRSRLLRNRSLLVLFIFVAIEITRLTLTRATFFNRYFIPELWATIVLFGLGLGTIWDQFTSTRTAKLLLTAALSITLFIGIGAGIQTAKYVRGRQTYRFDESLKQIGLWLNQNTAPESTILLEPLGYVGYYSDRIMIDEVGLVTPAVVRLKLQSIGSEQYPSIFRPDYLVLHCDDALRIQTDPETELAKNYSLVREFNPLAFNPSRPNQTPDPTGLARGSCYQIWQRGS